MKIADAAIVYRPAEDGDMIQFGPNCALSIDKVAGLVGESGPIVKKAFCKWLDDFKAQACADAFKPLAEAAAKLAPIVEVPEQIQLLRDIRDSIAEVASTLNDVTANRREFHVRGS